MNRPLKDPENMVALPAKHMSGGEQVDPDEFYLRAGNRRKLREAIEMLELAQIANDRGKHHVVADRAARVAKTLTDITETLEN